MSLSSILCTDIESKYNKKKGLYRTDFEFSHSAMSCEQRLEVTIIVFRILLQTQNLYQVQSITLFLFIILSKAETSFLIITRMSTHESDKLQNIHNQSYSLQQLNSVVQNIIVNYEIR